MRYKRLYLKDLLSAEAIYYNVFPDRDDFESEWNLMLKYGRIYGYYINDILIGFCSWVYYNDETWITLCNLTVDVPYHRKGYGTKIIKYIINQTKHRKKNILALTNEKNFFESVNFKIFENFEDDDLQPYKYIMKYNI
jgi:GNAT superfamily N-acetyltransferase